MPEQFRDDSTAGKPRGGRAPVSRQIWVDGALVPWEQATVHVLSHSMQRGSLVFDYMSAHETPRGVAVFRLGDHVERFFRSCELVGLPLELGRGEIERAIRETVRANLGSHSVKVSAYLPSIEVDVVPQDDRVSVAIAAYDTGRDVIARNPGQFEKRATVRLWIEKEIRNRRGDIVPPQAKVAANYVSPMLAKWKARRRGYDEILLIDEQGCVAEGPTTNVFLVDTDGALRTPPDERVLWGVTRRSILELAKHDGLTVCEESVRPEELGEASEVFLTGTTAGVWPVESIDGQPVGEGAPGPVSRALGEHFRRVVAAADSDFEHWLCFVDED